MQRSKKIGLNWFIIVKTDVDFIKKIVAETFVGVKCSGNILFNNIIKS